MEAWVQPVAMSVLVSMVVMRIRQVKLTLCPPHSLLPESTEGVGSHLVRDDVHIMNCLLATAVRSQSRVDVFSKHVAVHL